MADLDRDLMASYEDAQNGGIDVDVHFCPECGCVWEEDDLCASCQADGTVRLCRDCLAPIDEQMAKENDYRCLKCAQHYNLTVVSNLNDMWEDLLS